LFSLLDRETITQLRIAETAIPMTIRRIILSPIVAIFVPCNVACVALVCALSALPARSAEIKVISTGSFRGALTELAPAFEKSHGDKIAMLWAGTDEIVRRLAAGETLDIVIAPAPWIDDLIGRGWLATGSRVDLADSGIGVAIKAGMPVIDIRTTEALRSALREAPTIMLSNGVSGIYLTALFKKWGLAEELEPKIVRLPGSREVADAMVRGEADIAFLQTAEWLEVKGVTFVGPLPADIQEMTAISAGLNRMSAALEAARALLEFLASSAAGPAKTKTGLTPR
jgi:molybdate transport system substrate-binding protein